MFSYRRVARGVGGDIALEGMDIRISLGRLQGQGLHGDGRESFGHLMIRTMQQHGGVARVQGALGRRRDAAGLDAFHDLGIRAAAGDGRAQGEDVI